MHRQPGECRRTQTETAAIRKYYFFVQKQHKQTPFGAILATKACRHRC